ncbi:MAG: sigma factor-like helix-turn-helix DNA-binding protein [Isosphaerales bacterium]
MRARRRHPMEVESTAAETKRSRGSTVTATSLSSEAAARKLPLHQAAVGLCHRIACDVPWIRRWWRHPVSLSAQNSLSPITTPEGKEKRPPVLGPSLKFTIDYRDQGAVNYRDHSHRLAIILCDLEGMTQAQAANQLHWSERTLRHRLAEGRARLKRRLARRGLAPDGATLGALFLHEARTAVPTAWHDVTVRAALDLVNHTLTAGAVSAAVGSLTREVLKIMLVQKLKLATAVLFGAGLMAWVATATLISRGDEPQEPAPAPVAQRTTPPATPQPEPDPPDTIGTFPVAGRVLDPDGKPVAGAEIFIRHYTESGWDPADPAPKGQKGRVAVSDAEGRFHFELDKASSDWPNGDEPAWHKAQIAAAAPVFARVWVEAGSLVRGGKATLRLVRDDVPIRGHVLDTQGRPVAGATVRLRQIGTVKDGIDLDAMLASGEFDHNHVSGWYGSAGWYVENESTWLGGRSTWTTGADGRFEVKGIGRDRIARLEIHGPMLAEGTLYVMARPAKAPPKPRPHPTGRLRETMFNGGFGLAPKPQLVGAAFEYIAGPSRPITGVVRLKGTGKPLEGITVLGTAGATWTQVVTRTDAQGRFRFLGLPKGELYQLHAFPRPGVDPFLGATVNLTDTAGLEPIETVLELPRGVIVTGRLIDKATGRPVWPSQVHHAELPSNQNEGSSNGFHSSLTVPTFRLTVPAGAGMIYAKARGKDAIYSRARLRKADKGKGLGGFGDGETHTMMLSAYHAYKIVDVPADAELLTVDLELTRGLTRKGRVVDRDGQPVTGAQCYGLIATWGQVKTLADDTFEVVGLEPDHPRQLIFAHKGRRLVGSVIIKGEEAKSDAPLVVRLEPPGSIKGRLVDDDGFPLAGATLGALSFGLDGSNLPQGLALDAMWPDSETFTTGADGAFQIDGLKPGIKTNSGAQFKDRPNLRLDTGKVLRDIVIRQSGEVRDLGDVKVKVVRSNP